MRQQQAAYGQQQTAASPRVGGQQQPHAAPNAPQYGPMGYYTTQTPQPSQTPHTGSRQSNPLINGQNRPNVPPSRRSSPMPQPSGAARRGGRNGGR